MATGFQQLNTTIYIAATAAAHITNAADQTVHCNGIYLHNTHTSSLTVTLYVVPDDGGSAGTASAANQIYKKTLTTLQTVIINDVPMYLADEGDTLQAVCGTANKVTLFAEGYIESTP